MTASTFDESAAWEAQTTFSYDARTSTYLYLWCPPGKRVVYFHTTVRNSLDGTQIDNLRQSIQNYIQTREGRTLPFKGFLHIYGIGRYAVLDENGIWQENINDAKIGFDQCSEAASNWRKQVRDHREKSLKRIISDHGYVVFEPRSEKWPPAGNLDGFTCHDAVIYGDEIDWTTVDFEQNDDALTVRPWRMRPARRSCLKEETLSRKRRELIATRVAEWLSDNRGQQTRILDELPTRDNPIVFTRLTFQEMDTIIDYLRELGNLPDYTRGKWKGPQSGQVRVQMSSDLGFDTVADCFRLDSREKNVFLTVTSTRITGVSPEIWQADILGREIKAKNLLLPR